MVSVRMLAGCGTVLRYAEWSIRIHGAIDAVGSCVLHPARQRELARPLYTGHPHLKHINADSDVSVINYQS
jgi:hypothetical protein